MKVIVAVLVAVVIIQFILLRKGGSTKSVNQSVLLERARNLAALEVRDGTNTIQSADSNSDDLILTDVIVQYAPNPILTITEWSDSGQIGQGRGIARAQWSCPPSYELRWDDAIPYCQPRVRQ